MKPGNKSGTALATWAHSYIVFRGDCIHGFISKHNDQNKAIRREEPVFLKTLQSIAIGRSMVERDIYFLGKLAILVASPFASNFLQARIRNGGGAGMEVWVFAKGNQTKQETRALNSRYVFL